ncbi:MAG: hypothetical protein WDZ45_11110 [Flavobacteriaceae bacterium]
MKKNIVYILSLTFLLNLGCKENTKTDSQNLDREKTNEILTQIINDSTDLYMDTNCISEKNRLLYTIFTTDLNNYIKNQLGINEEEHLKNQMELFHNFRFTENLTFGKQIITVLDFKEFENQAENGNYTFWTWLDSNCENGYLSISKPVFNETFDKAFVIIGSICGGKCGGGETRFYKFKNGKWKIEKTEFEWIS